MENIFSFLPLSFILITLASLFLIYQATKDKPTLIILSIWAVILTILSLNGFYAELEAIPPRPIFLFVPIILLVIFLSRRLKPGMGAVKVLLAIHILRIFVELVLHQIYIKGDIPVDMTYEGFNFDIISGISALILFFLVQSQGVEKYRKLIYYWNFLGLALLAIVVTTAILSLPTPFQQLNFDQPNEAVLYFPYVLLPGIVVLIVLLSHILLLKTLGKGKA